MTSDIALLDPAVLDALPDISKARYPTLYANARAALVECSQIDECQDWANKMDAMASYARQAHDNELRIMCDRIKARASRRVGELLRSIPPGKNQHDARGDASPSTRTQAATDAGLSRDQRRTALRLANVPHDEFEAAVESARPPTVTSLAERGTKKLPAERRVRGLNEDEYSDFCSILGAFKWFTENVETADVSVLRRTLSDDERVQLRADIATVRAQVDTIEAAVWGEA